MRLWLAALSLMASLLFCCPSACAGTYVWQTTDASGTVTARSPVISGGFWYTYGDSPKPYSIGYSGSGGSAETGGYAGQISSTGTIRTVYTWQPSYAGEPAPPVVIEQTCEATYKCDFSSAGGASASDASCSDGLDDPPIKDAYGNEHSSGTHYRAVVPDSTGKIMVDLVGAQAHTPASSFTNCTVWYTINAYPVTINLTGQNTANQALTGQQITATLNGVLSGVKVTSYTWSFDSGVATKPASPIKNWDETASGDPTHPQLVPLTDADLKGTDTSGNGISVSPVNFYDEVQENVTVKRAVSLKFADGTTATINAKSVPVAFLKPSLSKWLIDTGYIQASTTNPGYFGLYAAPGSGFPGGEYWHDVTIDVPQPFSGGQGCIVQLITPAFELYKDGSPIVYADPNDKKKGLDNSFPYTQWDLPALGKESDVPQIGVAGVNVPQDQGFRTGTFNDAFVTWVMYKPPVFGTHGHIWVPIRSYSWNTSFTLQWVNNQWTFNAPVPSATTRATPRNPVQTDTPPSWSLIQTNTHH